MTRTEGNLKEDQQQLFEDEVSEMVDGKVDVAQDGFERIVLEYGVGHDQGYKVAFKGQEIYSCYDHTAYATSKGKILIYSDFGTDGAAYKIYDNVTDAAEVEDHCGVKYYPVELMSAIGEHYGEEFIEELDI